MKKTLLHATLAGVAFLFVPALHAITEREGFEVVDFPNSAAGVTATYTYTLTTGTNTFQGSLPFGSGDADYFKIVVPAGMRITQIALSTIPSGFNGSFTVPSTPVNAGTYTISFAGLFLQTENWSVVFTLAAIPDFDVVTSNGTLTVTDNTNLDNTLTLSEPSNGSIKFAAASRTFSVNNGAYTTGDSGSVSLSGIVSVSVNGGNGNYIINVGGFTNSNFPLLGIDTGTGADTVNFNGNLTFATNNSLVVGGLTSSAGTVNVNGAQLILSGSGAIDLECSQSIAITGGAVLQTASGNITLMANQQTPATAGNFTGVTVDGSGTRIQATAVSSSAIADITINGRGGNDPGGFQLGVNVSNGAQIIGGYYSYPTITGTGGASSGIVNRGVTVYGAGSAITGGGDFGVMVIGNSGTLGSGYGIGVSVLYGGKINSTGVGEVSVTATGGGASGDFNQGVEIGGAASPASAITTSGFVNITATSGPGNSVGLFMSDSGTIGPASTVGLTTDSVSLDSSISITSNDANAGIYVSTSQATHIDLGGNNAAGTLGFTAAELARLNGVLIFSSGDIAISAPLVRSSATNLVLNPTVGLHATASGTDIDLHGGSLTLVAPGSLDMPITGPAPDTGFPQLNVSASGISIVVSGGIGQPQTLVPLDLTGTTYGGMAGQQFTILKNNNNAPLSGMFQGLPEGAYLVWPGDATLAAQISYVGGASGHDVVLTLVPVANALRVTSTADDTSIGSLPTVLAFAAAHSGADTITFDPTLGGQTITLTGPANGYAVTIGDSAGVTIDASNLLSGLTIQGTGPSGNFGLFFVGNGATLTLRGLTLANGGGSAFTSAGHFGGAIESNGTLTLIGCTLVGNSARGGGAISNGGTLTLTQCTLSGNSASDVGGGAILNSGSLTVTQCTLAANSSTSGSGGAILCDPSPFAVSLTLTNSIVAGNSASPGADIFVQPGPNTIFTVSGANVVQSISGIAATGSGTIINAAPLLATLGSYGGPTQTMPPLLGSPAIDHGVNASLPNDPATGLPFTTDQRGKTRIQNGMVDIGAVETTALQVTTKQDFGNTGSLRQIVSQATDVTNTITFAPSLSGAVSTLVSGEITLSSNIAIDASALSGGFTIFGNGSSRIFTTNSPATVVLTNLILTGGNGAGAISTGSGGAIYNSGATLTLNQCTLGNNSTSGSAGIGAAIRQTTGTLTLNRCTVANNNANTSSANVGGVAGGSGTLALNQCTFTGNSTVGVAGAVAIAAGGGVLTVNQCTISGNQAALQGGGINSNGALTLTNSIVAENAAPIGADIDSGGGTVTRSGRNVIGNNDTVATQFPTGNPNGNGDYAGTTASPVDPLLAPLGSYGGPTFTMALLMGTPAHNAAVNSPFTSDQRSFAITDGHPDIGAYEAGDTSNYFAWIYENLPASTANNAAAHATTFDFDGDGVTNFNEWLLLTNPGDPASYLHITQTTRSGSNFSITFPSVLGRHYSVEGCTDLVSWTSIDGPLSGTGSSITRSYIVPVGTTPKYFLRVRGGP